MQNLKVRLHEFSICAIESDGITVSRIVIESFGDVVVCVLELADTIGRVYVESGFEIAVFKSLKECSGIGEEFLVP